MKNRVMNKFVLSVAISIYSGLSLLWCYIVFRSIVFEGYQIKWFFSEAMGGVDFYDLYWKMIKFEYLVFRAVFIILSLLTIILLGIALLKRKRKRIWFMNVFLFAVLTHNAFVLIPSMSYLTDWYILVEFIWSGFKYARVAYHIVSVVMIGLSFWLYSSTSVFTTKKWEWL